MSLVSWGPQGLAVVKLRDEAGAVQDNRSGGLTISINDKDIATMSGHLGTDQIVQQAREGMALDLAVNQRILRSQIKRYRELTIVRSVGFRNSQSEQVLLCNEWLARVVPSLTPETVAGHAAFVELASLAEGAESIEVACGPLTAYDSELRRRALQQCGWCELPSPDEAARMLGQLSQLARRAAAADADVTSPTGRGGAGGSGAAGPAERLRREIDAVASAIPIPLVRRCCDEGDLERAAAITLLHGFPGPAVQLLMLASEGLRASVRERTPAAHAAQAAHAAAMQAAAAHYQWHAASERAMAGGLAGYGFSAAAGASGSHATSAAAAAAAAAAMAAASAAAAPDAALAESLAADATHAELLQLTAMAVAGCPGPALGRGLAQGQARSRGLENVAGEGPSGAHTSSSASGSEALAAAQREASRHVWLASVRALMPRIAGHRHPYLRMTLQVLLEVADPDAGPDDDGDEDEDDYDHDGEDEDALAMAAAAAGADRRHESAAAAEADRRHESAAAAEADRRHESAAAAEADRRHESAAAPATLAAATAGTRADGAASGSAARREPQPSRQGQGQVADAMPSGAGRRARTSASASGAVSRSGSGAAAPGRGSISYGGGGAGTGPGGTVSGISSSRQGHRPTHNLDTLGSRARAGAADKDAAAAASAELAEADKDEAGAAEPPEFALDGHGHGHGGGDGGAAARARARPGAASSTSGSIAGSSMKAVHASHPHHPPDAVEQTADQAANGSGAGNGGSAVASADREHIEISLHDRVAFACRFLPDGHATAFLSTITEEAVERGRIDGLMLAGLTPTGARLVQRYVDRTADVQTAAVVGCYMLRAAQLQLVARAQQLQASVLRDAAVEAASASSAAGTPGVGGGSAGPAFASPIGGGARSSIAGPGPARTHAVRVLTQLGGGGGEGLARLLPEDSARMVCLAWRWLQSYREFLSKLQMWHARAIMDVQRSQLLGTQFKGYVPAAAAAGGAGGVAGAAPAAAGPFGGGLGMGMGAGGFGVGGAGSGAALSLRPIATPELERLAFAALLSLASYAGGLVPQPSCVGAAGALVAAPAAGLPQAAAAGAAGGAFGSGASVAGLGSGASVVTASGAGGAGGGALDGPRAGGTIGGGTVGGQGAGAGAGMGMGALGGTVGGGGGGGTVAGGLISPAAAAHFATAAADGLLGLGPKRSQMFVRCGSCRASLSLPALVAGSASAVEWLAKQRPSMLACPACKKGLPRCSLCLLPMGVINPFLQLEHEMRQRTAARAENASYVAADSAASIRHGLPAAARPAPASASSTAGDGTMSTPARGSGAADAADAAGGSTAAVAHAFASAAAGSASGSGSGGGSFDPFPPGRLRDAIAFDDFWCWCNSCRHGGHASHLAEWFASKSVCPVAECLCHCAKQDGFAASLRGVDPSLLRSGSVARWGLPFSGGKLSAAAASAAAVGAQ